MIPSSSRLRLALVLVSALFVSSSAFAAGFEKAQTWSAKAAALGGAVVGSTSGAEALYFNPAGLAESPKSGELSVNFSPTFSKFSGTNPFSQAGSIGGSTGFSPVGGIVASYQPMPKLGLGAGYYVSGGNKAKFENLNYAGTSPLSSNFDSLNPTVETSLNITEAAIGAGYEVAPGLRFGLAWRMVKVSGKFSTVSLNPNSALAEITVDNISATRYNAWKLGAQYEEPHHRWGLGVNLRTAVSFTATADTSGRFETAAPGSTVQNLGTGTAQLDNAFPYQLAFGGWTRATELVRIGWEYSFTNYAQNKAIDIRGSVGVTSLSSIPQNWKNMHIVRLGGEFTGATLPLRLGYAYTSAVTPTDFARSTFASPGSGHSFSFGSGFILNTNIDVDGALEYSFASGTGHNRNAPAGVQEVGTDGKFSSNAYVAHVSGKYHF